MQHNFRGSYSGVLKKKKQSCDTRTIYRYIQERAPHLKMYLRSQKGKYRRKHGTKKRQKAREQAKKRRIDERPRVAERRGRHGDFEGDTLQGRDKRVRIVTFVDRRTGYLIAFLLPKMNAELLTVLALKHFQRIQKKKRKTITFDIENMILQWKSTFNRLGMTWQHV